VVIHRRKPFQRNELSSPQSSSARGIWLLPQVPLAVPKRHCRPNSGITSGSVTHSLERSKANMSAYSHHLSGTYATISTYERSMSKKTLDTD
jgi:hypothetical protein